MAEFGDLVRPEIAVRKALVARGGAVPRVDLDGLVVRGRRLAVRMELHMVGAIRQPNGDYVGREPQLPSPKQSHCKRGHPFDEANTYRHPAGLRVCRACSRQLWAEKQEERSTP